MAASADMDAPAPPITRPQAVLAAALLALHAGLALHQAARQAPTYDEPYYAPAGLAHLVRGEQRLNPEHPPVVKLWLGASWLGAGLPDLRAVPGFAAHDQWTFGPSLLYRDPARVQGLLLRARASVVLLSVLLGLGVLWMGRRAFGPEAGLLALALYALDPLVVANAGLATLDLGTAAAIFAAVALSWAALDRGGAGWLAGAAAATGLALGAKGTGLVVLPALALLVLAPLLRAGGARAGELGVRGRRALAVAAGGAVVLSVACLPEGPRAWWTSIARQQAHARAGHAAWAAGVQSTTCMPWYFPFAWAVKTPLPVLAASAAGLALLLSRIRREPARAVAVAGPPALLVAAALASGICNGVRQLLPATPFLAVAGGAALGALWRTGRSGRAASLLAVAWMGAALVRVHPDAITWSNELAGGPSRTWTRLTDSNVDWGQSLGQVADALRGEPVRTVWLDYFGTAWPPAHGLPAIRKVQDWRFRAGAVLPVPRRDGPDPAGREIVAVSATCLVDAYVAETDLHAWLRERTPWRWAGNSIALFDVTGDAAAYRSLARMAERMRDPLTAAEARTRAAEIERDRAGRPGP